MSGNLAYSTLIPHFAESASRLLILNGGEGEIRTHGTRKGSTVFETAAFDHSATSPSRTSPKIPGTGLYHPRTVAKINGATMDASDSMSYLVVSMLSFSQVILSFVTAPDY